MLRAIRFNRPQPTIAITIRTLVPALISELQKRGASDMMVVVGGVIPQQDYEFLFNSGVACVFGPGEKFAGLRNWERNQSMVFSSPIIYSFIFLLLNCPVS
jgi:hypothetical protein